MSQKDTLTVFYNGRCGICGPEVAMYQRMAQQHGVDDLRFNDIFDGDTPDNIDEETLLKRIHARRNSLSGDEILVGVDAFIEMWLRLPRFKYLAYAINWPIMRNMTGLIYNYIVAPWLYRRYARAQCNVSPNN